MWRRTGTRLSAVIRRPLHNSFTSPLDGLSNLTPNQFYIFFAHWDVGGYPWVRHKMDIKEQSDILAYGASWSSSFLPQPVLNGSGDNPVLKEWSCVDLGAEYCWLLPGHRAAKTSKWPAATLWMVIAPWRCPAMEHRDRISLLMCFPSSALHIDDKQWQLSCFEKKTRAIRRITGFCKAGYAPYFCLTVYLLAGSWQIFEIF